MTTVFFTDGVLANSISSAAGVLEKYVVSSETRAILGSLKNLGARIGMIVHRRNQPQEFVREVLNQSGLLNFLDQQLIVYGNDLGNLPFKEALAREDASGRKLFVSEHSTTRKRAIEAGFDAASPHPLLVSEILEQASLAYVRVSGLNGQNWAERLNPSTQMPLVPFYLNLAQQGSAYIITSTRMAETIGGMGFDVNVFDKEHDPQITDAYLAHDDRRPSQTDPFEEARDILKREGKARFILSVVDRALILALPPEISIEEIHFPGALHGHNRRLLADTSLIRSLVEVSSNRTARPNVATATVGLSDTEVEVLQKVITADTITAFHAQYVGDEPLDGFGFHVSSRHVSEDHNAAVTTALCNRLTAIGGTVMAPPKRHDFPLEPKVLSNIEAELPGSEPDSFVIISAHFDSTARLDDTNNPAPGADDDASGVAAVLAAAQAAVELRASGQLKGSLRFVLFNAEEDFILGSQIYARYQFQNGVTIRGVFQMDMIGHTGGVEQREFEVHTGFPTDHIETKSAELATIISSVIKRVSNLNEAQVYPNTPGGDDPLFDRSDHTSFQVRGYAACAVCEDANSGPAPNSPDPRPNPNYHRKTDRQIDKTYAAEIARVVAAAAIVAAKN